MNYQYITQEIIEEGTINITSAAMHAEAVQYNKRMKLFYQKKKLVSSCYLVWCVAQYVLLGYCLFYMQMENEPSVLLTLRTLAGVPYAVLFYFLIIKYKKSEPIIALLVSLPLLLVHVKLLVLLLANVILAHLYSKLRTEMEAEPGYPHFVTLHITYQNEF